MTILGYNQNSPNKQKIRKGSVKMSEKSSTNAIKFIVFSLIGIFMFFFPIEIGGKSTIPLDHMVSWIQGIPYYVQVYGFILITLGAILPFIRKDWNKNLMNSIFSIAKVL